MLPLMKLCLPVVVEVEVVVPVVVDDVVEGCVAVVVEPVVVDDVVEGPRERRDPTVLEHGL